MKSRRIIRYLATAVLFSLVLMSMPQTRALTVITIGASGTPTYLGQVFVTASGASKGCSIGTIGSAWIRNQDGSFHTFIHYADYLGINFRGYFSISAPGWFDSAYAKMTIYHWNGASYIQVDQNSDGTDSYWNGNMYLPGDQVNGGYYAISTPPWRVAWEAIGYDNANLSCYAQYIFYISNG